MDNDGASYQSSNPCCQQLGEKLEKSEAGRRKLRQAISILNEKLDATEKVLKINETLRQECEKERQHAEEEKQKTEEERRLREAIEKDAATFKDQLIQVIQRLGVVENCQKADKREMGRLRSEVKVAVEGVRAASQAVDAAQSSLSNLERSILTKVADATTASSKAATAAHSAQSTAGSAQAAAKAARMIADTAKKESHAITARVAVLQKQSTDLEQRISRLQQELKVRLLVPQDAAQEVGITMHDMDTAVPDSGNKNSWKSAASSKHGERRMVLSRNQRHTDMSRPVHDSGLEKVQQSEDSFTRADGSLSGCPVTEVIPGISSILKTVGTVTEGRSQLHWRRVEENNRIDTSEIECNGRQGFWTGHKVGLPNSKPEKQVAVQILNQDNVIDTTGKDGTVSAVTQKDLRLDRGKNKKGRSKNHKDAPQRLVDNITRLFTKEKKAHLKIEEHLAKLKDLLKPSSSGKLLTSISTAVQKGRSKQKRKEHEVMADIHTEDSEQEEAVSRKKRRVSKLDISKHDKGETVIVTSIINADESSEQMRKLDNAVDGPVAEKLPSLMKSSLMPLCFGTDVSTVSNKDCDVMAVNERFDRDQVWKHDTHDLNKSLVGGDDVDMPTIGLEGVENVCPGKDDAARNRVCNLYSNDSETEKSDGDFSYTSEDDPEENWWSTRVLLSPTLPEVSPPISEPSSPLFQKTGISISNETTICEQILTSENSELAHAELGEFEQISSADCVEQSNGGIRGYEHNVTAKGNICSNRQTFTGSISLTVSKIKEKNGPDLLAKETGHSIKDSAVALSLLNQIGSERDATYGKPEENNIDADFLMQQLEAPIEPSCGMNVLGKDAGIAGQDKILQGLGEVKPLCDTFPTPTFAISSPHEETSEDALRDRSFGDDFLLDGIENANIKEISNFLTEFPSISRSNNEEEGKEDVSSNREGNLHSLSAILQCSSSVPPHNTSITAPTKEQSTRRNCRQGFSALHRDLSELKLFEDMSNGGFSAQKEVKVFPDAIVRLEDNMCTQVLDVSERHRNSSQRSCEVALLHGGCFHGTISERGSLIRAALVATKMKKFFSSSISGRPEVAKLEESLAALKGNYKFPREHFSCSLVSTAVDILMSKRKGEHLWIEGRVQDDFLHSFIDFVKRVTTEEVMLIFDIMVQQLTRFISEGLIYFITFSESEVWDGEISITEMDSTGENSQLFVICSSSASLEKIHVGSKVLATLYHSFSCINRLQIVVYNILRWCDKDVTWLLTIFCSFASVCGRDSFVLGCNDLLGHAVCAIILELMVGFEEDAAKRVELGGQVEISIDPRGSQVLEGWEKLRESMEAEGSCSFETVLQSLLESLQRFLSPTHGSLFLKAQLVGEGSILSKQGDLVKGSQAIQNTGLPCYGTHHEVQNSVCQEAEVQEGKIMQNRMKDSSATMGQLLNHGSEVNQHLAENVNLSPVKSNALDLDWITWQGNFREVLGSLDLMACYMGWEWTYNELIVKCLWTLVEPGAAEITLAALVNFLGMLGRLGKGSGGREMEGVEELRKCLAFVLCPTSITSEKSKEHGFSLVVQAAAAQALLELSLPRMTCFEWVVNNESTTTCIDKCDVQPLHLWSLRKIHLSYLILIKKWFDSIGLQRQGMLPKFMTEVLLSFFGTQVV